MKCNVTARKVRSVIQHYAAGHACSFLVENDMPTITQVLEV